MIYGTIGKNVLNYNDFLFTVSHTIALCNKRPIAFKEGLRDSNPLEDIPEAITPEVLMKGHPIVDVNINPKLQPDLIAEWKEIL